MSAKTRPIGVLVCSNAKFGACDCVYEHTVFLCQCVWKQCVLVSQTIADPLTLCAPCIWHSVFWDELSDGSVFVVRSEEKKISCYSIPS